MNRKDIDKLWNKAMKQAVEAGEMYTKYHFAALVAAAEREELKKLDWTALLRDGGLVTWGDAAELGDRVIAAIRARGQE